MHALDLETASISGTLSDGFALEPWRVRQGKAYISYMDVYGDKIKKQVVRPTRDQIIETLEELRGEEVYCHFALFDVAWMIASIEPNKLARLHEAVKGVRWRDTALLAKWCVNGRKAQYFSFSLLNLIETFKDKMGYEGADDFIRMKQAEHMEDTTKNDDYWRQRGSADTLWTYRLAKFLESKLPEECRRGYVIEARSIPQIANSWLIGVHVDRNRLAKAEAETEKIIQAGCLDLGLSEAVLGSPAQLGHVVFNQWGFEPISRTPSGKPSADADTWIMLAFQTGDERMKKILKVRQALTVRSKYIVAAYEAIARTGDDCMYGKPMMFGTDSGRLTYSSETMKGLRCSTAQHQIPRKDKLVRAYMGPPPGMKLYETDAAAQESRIMGIWSGDEEIIRIFRDGINFHSYMASQIYGYAYEEFQKSYKVEDAIEGGTFTERRQMGKLTNLACNFRIGGKSLAKKALTEYDTYLTEIEGRKLVSTFKRTYPGVPRYWDNIIAYAREHGYSYTLAHRRYKVPVDMLNSSDAWKVEGTLISHPIQGTGAEMFYAALSQVPDARLCTNMHDGQFWVLDDGPEGVEEAEYIIHQMNSTPYQKLWQLENPLPIDLQYEESKIGTSFADVK